MAKLFLNLILLNVPTINIYGASIGSISCHIIAFTIAFIVLNRKLNLNISFIRFVFKPILASFIMGICSYYIFIALHGILVEKLATLISIFSAIIIYIISIIVLKIFTKDDFYLLPFGQKIYVFLEKLGIY